MLNDPDGPLEHRGLLCAGHRQRVFVEIAMNADFMAGFDQHFSRAGKAFHGVTCTAPGCSNSEMLENLEHLGPSALSGKPPPQNIAWRIFAAERADPQRDGIEVGIYADLDVLGHLA